MNFLHTWQQLDEIYDVVDFNSTGTEGYESGNGLLYHFYQDLSDLLNSLKTGIIYSTKNDSDANKAQFDFGVSDGMSYVCMTNTLDGKNYMTKKFKRPFGLSFKNDRVNGLCKEGEFIRSFSAFGAKGEYKTNKNGSKTLLATTKERGHNPFYIYSIGCLPPNPKDAEQKLRYFVCGGQGTGVSGAWASQIFYDEKLYNELKDWFTTNYRKGEEYQQRMYYHFKNGNIGNVTKTHDGTPSGLPIEVDGNLNTGYVARRDFDTKGNNKGKATYGSTISFKMTSDFGLEKSFIEVLGYGPVDVKENGKVLLKFTFVNPNAVAGYQGPLLFGKNIDATGNNSFANVSKTITARSSSSKPEGEERKIKSQQRHLVASQELFDKLCDVFNENEYRIYLKNSRDLRFDPADVETIVLPEKFTLAAYKDIINVGVLIDYLNPNTNYSINYNNVDELIDSGVLTTNDYQPKKGRRKYSNYTIKLTQTLAQLLDNTYGNVSVELIPNTSSKETTPKAKASLGKYLKTGIADGDNDLKISAKTNKIVANDHSRKLVTYWPDLSQVHETPGENGEVAVLAPIPLSVPDEVAKAAAAADPNWNKARLGSEVILTANDINGNRYVLFVYKSKSQSFMELPGGGFDSKSQVKSNDSFKDALAIKLRRKCNLISSDITEPVDVGALILNEKGVAKTDEVTWHWSYYRLYKAELREPISEECLKNLGYTFDNREVEEALIDPETGITVKGYRAHLRWVPLDSIELNRAVTDRYSNILHLIK